MVSRGWIFLLLISLVLAACNGAENGAGDEPTAQDDAEVEGEPTDVEEDTATEPAEEETSDELVWGEDGVLQPLASGFPEDTITVQIAHPPGHADELYARTMIEAAEALSPVPLVVENQPTGPRLNYESLDYMETVPGGTEGYHTVVWALSAAPVRELTVLGTGDRWSLEDVAQGTVLITEEEPVVLAVLEDSEFEDLDDLVAFAEENPERLRIATSSIGSLVHLNSELLASDRDFTYTPVPSDGVGDAQQVLLGGGAEAVTTLPAQVAPLIEEGRVRGLLQWGEASSDLLPDVPTSADLGLQGVGVTRGLVAHPDTPPEHLAWLEALFMAAAEEEPYQRRLEEFGQGFLLLTGEEAGETLFEVRAAVEPIVTELGLLADE